MDDATAERRFKELETELRATREFCAVLLAFLQRHGELREDDFWRFRERCLSGHAIEDREQLLARKHSVMEIEQLAREFLEASPPD